METSQPSAPQGYSASYRMPQGELLRYSRMVAEDPLVKKVLDTMPEMMAIMTFSRQLLLANQAMLVFLGFDKGELIPGPRPGELLSCINAQKSDMGCGNSSYCQECGAFRTIMKSITEHRRAKGECSISYERDGRIETMEMSLMCSPFVVGDMDFILFASVDAHDKDRRAAMERIFFRDVLDDFSVFMGCLDRLANASPDEAGTLNNTVSAAAEVLVDEIASPRYMHKAEENKLSVLPTMLNSVDMLNKLALLYSNHQLAQGRSIKVQQVSDSRYFTCDATLLFRVLGIMTKNALEAVEEGGVIEVGCHHRGAFMEFWVHNTGHMSPEVQNQVFQRFFSTKGQGKGLGTYSMRLLVERYLEGEAGFHSTSEDGTTFTVRVPVNPSYAITADSGF